MNTGTPPVPGIVLASASPRRRAILKALGFEFEVIATGLDEEAITAESPRARVMKIAAAKAEEAAGRIADAREKPRLIVAADTEVVLDGRIFGKPSDREDAKRMLAELAGRTHEVISAVAMKSLPGGEIWIHAERTQVCFRKVDPGFVAQYVATGEADDKAGGYGIQGMGGELIESFKGSLSNVIGLPLAAFAEGFRVMTGWDAGVDADERKILRKAFPDMEPLLKLK